MSIDTAATMKKKPSSRRTRTWAERRTAPRVLLNITAAVGIHSNRTSARSRTRNKVPVQVSFVFRRPPQLSTVFVHTSDLNLAADDPPEIVCSEEDLLLLRVNVGKLRASKSPDDCDYFIYRAHPSFPSLELLQRPHPFFHVCDVGLLPRSGGHYTLAALVRTGERDLYKLHLFHSDTASSGWSSTIVSAPEQVFPVEIPRKCHQLLYHHTTTVISIGGERGTMGWVDLWRGILLCDLLDPNPTLRGMPLPLPLQKMRSNHGLGAELGYPGHRRGISFVRDKGCLNFVHMEVTGNRLPDYDAETGTIAFHVDDWTLTTWSNKEMSDSLDDWKEGITVEASKISIDHDPVVSQALEKSGLLCKPHNSEEAAARQQGLQNLMMCQPTPCAKGEDVVYLLVRKKFMHPMAWILAVEMKYGGRLQSVSYSGHQIWHFGGPTYCSSRISKFLNPKMLKNPATIRAVDRCAEESAQAGGLDNLTTIRVDRCAEESAQASGLENPTTIRAALESMIKLLLES